MDNNSKAWQAFVRGLRAFADTLEAELTATNKNSTTQEAEAPTETETAEATPDKAEAVTPEEAPVAANTAETAPEDTPEEKEITLPEIRAFLAEKSRVGFTGEVRELLKKHGSSRLSRIDPTEYAAIMKEAEGFGS